MVWKMRPDPNFPVTLGTRTEIGNVVTSTIYPNHQNRFVSPDSQCGKYSVDSRHGSTTCRNAHNRFVSPEYAPVRYVVAWA